MKAKKKIDQTEIIIRMIYLLLVQISIIITKMIICLTVYNVNNDDINIEEKVRIRS